MAVRTIPPLVAYAREVMAARARRLDHQLHQPRRAGHAGADVGDRRAGRGHLRHADRGVPGSRARPGPAGGGVPLRLRRPQSPRLHPRGVLAGTAAAARLWENEQALAARLPDAAVLDRHGCASCACCPPSTSSITTRRNAPSPTCARRATREGRSSRGSRATCSRISRRARRTRWRATSAISPIAAPATCSSSPAARVAQPLPRRGPTSPATTRSRSTPSRRWCGTRTR